MPICEPHWGNCNEDARDGCEASIQHRVYCEGDPRIAEERAPTITFLPTSEKRGPGSISSLALSAAFERARPALQACYEKVLATAPHASATMTFMLSISATGCVHARKTAGDTSPALEACAKRLFEQLRLAEAPSGGTVEWAWEIFLGPADP